MVSDQSLRAVRLPLAVAIQPSFMSEFHACSSFCSFRAFLVPESQLRFHRFGIGNAIPNPHHPSCHVISSSKKKKIEKPATAAS
ncbi:hypothetical protein GUJ93_ZPchr0005g15979 [Zizania palustris]|uniref:Uncharacterized protein n=1 Tax=Zizania palustris TaxID=103762 RepID=A0A8J5SBK7_ZIZPA|nr:hypothetical protein GUJ93_ZPchr0005g15979 [Zizania palustris]